MTRWTILRWVLLAYGLCVFVPWKPLTTSADYEYAMHVASARHWQFGVDVVSTYGPFGYLGLPYFYRRTFTRLVLANVFAFIVGVLVIDRFVRDQPAGPLTPSASSVVVAVAPALMPTTVYAASQYLPFAALNAFVLHTFVHRASPGAATQIIAGALLAACALVKPTFWLPIGVAISVVAVDLVLTTRRVPVIAPAFAGALLVMWIAAGQHPAYMGTYFLGTLDVVGGFRDGMSSATRRGDAIALVFAAASVTLVAAVIEATRRQLRWRALGPALTLAATLFALFQHGFIRADDPHIVPAYLTLAALAVLVIPVWGRAVSWQGVTTTAIGLLPLCASWFLGTGRPSTRALIERPRHAWSLVTRGVAPLEAEVADRMIALRRAYPLAGVREPIDTSAIDLALGDANGLDAMVRPSVTPYSAFTPRLAAINRAYFERSDGPATVLVNASGSVDGRYPTLTDSLALLSMRSHFAVTARTDQFLVLERRPQPLPLRLIPMDRRSGSIGESIAVPDYGADPVWTELDISSTVLGSLLSLAYRPAMTFISTESDEGGPATFRLTRAIARTGMILSPLVRDLEGLEALVSPSVRRPRHRVGAIRITAERGWDWSVERRVEVAFYRIASGEPQPVR